MKYLTLSALVVGGLILAQQAYLAQPPERRDSAQPSDQHAGDADLKPAHIEGTWTVVYMERDGKKLETGTDNTVKISGDMMTCTIDGKQERMRLMFAPNGMVYASWPDQEKRSEFVKEPQGGVVQASGREEHQAHPTADQEHFAHSHHGVYIASGEYLAFAFNKGELSTSMAPLSGILLAEFQQDETKGAIPAPKGPPAPDQGKTLATKPMPRPTDTAGKAGSGSAGQQAITSHFVVFLRKAADTSGNR